MKRDYDSLSTDELNELIMGIGDTLRDNLRVACTDTVCCDIHAILLGLFVMYDLQVALAQIAHGADPQIMDMFKAHLQHIVIQPMDMKNDTTH